MGLCAVAVMNVTAPCLAVRLCLDFLPDVEFFLFTLLVQFLMPLLTLRLLFFRRDREDGSAPCFLLVVDVPSRDFTCLFFPMFLKLQIL